MFTQRMHVAHNLSSAGVPEGSCSYVSFLHQKNQIAFSLAAVTVSLHAAEMAICI